MVLVRAGAGAVLLLLVNCFITFIIVSMLVFFETACYQHCREDVMNMTHTHMQYYGCLLSARKCVVRLTYLCIVCSLEPMVA